MTRDSDNLAARLAREARDRERFDALSDRVAIIEDAAGRIREGLDTLLADRNGQRPPAIHWPDLDDDTLAERWAALDVWLQSVLADYAAPANLLRGRTCWREHPVAVAAVTAAWLTWVHAYRNPAAPIDACATWLDRWLPALNRQLGDELKWCKEQCLLPGPNAKPPAKL